MGFLEPGITSALCLNIPGYSAKKQLEMKVAITSTGDTLESKLDQRFGRCAWFVIYDSDSGETEMIPNPNKDVEEGAGPASVQLVASKGVKKIVSGEFGAKIKSLLDNLQIQMVIYKEPEKTVQSVIEMLKQ